MLWDSERMLLILYLVGSENEYVSGQTKLGAIQNLRRLEGVGWMSVKRTQDYIAFAISLHSNHLVGKTINLNNHPTNRRIISRFRNVI